MFIIYSFIYLLLFILALPFYILIRKLKGKAPIRILERLGFRLPEVKIKTKPVWIHAVSVGEVMATRPLIIQMKKDHPGVPIIMSVTTETGWNTAASMYKDEVQLIHFPFDFRFSVRRYLKSVNPALVIIMETELWPRFCLETKERGISLMLVNGRISETSFPQYMRMRFFFRKILRCFSVMIVQTSLYKDRIIKIGAEPMRIKIAPSLKYHVSNFETDPQKVKNLTGKLGLGRKNLIITAGSTHEGEEDIILSVYKKLLKNHPDIKLMIAPRRPQRFAQVEALIIKSGLTHAKLGNPIAMNDRNIILIDRMGELKNCYSISDIVFVGGSLIPHGGQNLLEAAAFSVPVIFGPYIYNFTETADMLLNSGGGFMVKNESELFNTVQYLLENPAERETAGKAARSVIDHNQGGLAIVMSEISKLLENNKD